MKVFNDRFWVKVEKAQGDGCWPWIGAFTSAGYGETWMDGKVVLAHRAAWVLANGPIPPGLHVLHRCDNPPCVRLDHLFLGTDADNAADKIAKGRHHPPHGERHGRSKLTESNVREIRRLRSENGLRKIELASRFGVSVTAIGSVLSGRTWSWLDG